MKTLNLDSLAKVERSITIGGKDYPVEDMTVENFIATTKDAESLGKDAAFIDQLEASVRMIRRSIPSIEESLLRTLTLEKLLTVVRFVRGDMDREIADPKNTVADDKGSEAGKA